MKVAKVVKFGGKSTNPLEFAKAIVHERPLTNCVTFHGAIANYKPKWKMPSPQITGITKFYGFTYEQDTIRVFRQSGIGVGKQLKMKLSEIHIGKNLHIFLQIFLTNPNSELGIRNWNFYRTG